jgi:hypothetical protein
MPRNKSTRARPRRTAKRKSAAVVIPRVREHDPRSKVSLDADEGTGRDREPAPTLKQANEQKLSPAVWQRAFEAAEKLAALTSPVYVADLLERVVRVEEWRAKYAREVLMPMMMKQPLEPVAYRLFVRPIDLGYLLLREVKDAPADVNPLLCESLLNIVEAARRGEEGPWSRPDIRQALAAAIPAGKRGKPKSSKREQALWAYEKGYPDWMTAAFLCVKENGLARLRSEGRSLRGTPLRRRTKP